MRRAARFAAVLACALALALAASAPAAPRPAPAHPARKPLPRAFVTRDICPFECCVYRRWHALRPIAVYAREARVDLVAFTIAPGDSFDALGGNVHVTRTGLARVLRAFQFGSGEGRVHLVPGDRLALLEPGEEGTTHVWIDGRESWLELDPMADAVPGGEPPYVRIVRRATSQWWVHVRALDGREGWFRAERAADGYPFDNADSCD